MSMAHPKVLYVSHNHPTIRPGGAETYALELYQAMKDSGRFEPIFVARTGPPMSVTRQPHEGTLFTPVGDDPNEYFFYTDVSDYDWLFGRSPDKARLTWYFREFLRSHSPDIVHFQHTLSIGYDAIRVVRNTLPDVPIVYTLHEFLPICHREGQMVRTRGEELCTEASPRRCHECFPHISPQTFFMRERFIKSHLSLVDLFIAPSRFLMERYVDWGIPQEKIIYEDYGRLPIENVPQLDEREVRDRFGFLGQLNPFKGADVLLAAAEELKRKRFRGQILIYGANLDLHDKSFQERFGDLLRKARGVISFMGQYERGDVSKVMAGLDWVVVPSMWWENSPLVIQEAFMYGLPVICSDIGGMAEKVEDGVNGLHFRRGDSRALAEVVLRASTSPDLWESLRHGIPQVHPMDLHVGTLTSLYDQLLAERSTRPTRVPDSAEAVEHV
jgi:glycosyltransferase involved in cell wall biosynthesis